MITWPAGPRWEDYRIDVLDNTLATIGSLGTVHKLHGELRLYGAYGGKLTFALEKSDPWASILNESKIHFVKIWRDGTAIFSGYQVKHERKDDTSADVKFVDFEFLPLAHMAKWRFGRPVPPATSLKATGAKLDDAMKWIVERTLGATAPATPTTALARAVTNFVVAADKTEYADDIEVDATYRNLYEVFQRLGSAYGVDWDIYLNASNYPEFETWYPRRGLDKSEGNGARAEVIFTDEHGMFTQVNYGVDSMDVATVVYDGMMAHDVAAAAGTITNWLLRDHRQIPYDATTMQTVLDDHAPKVSCTLDSFIEQANCYWDPAGTADIGFSLGDLITWRSLRMTYGPTNDVICGIDFDIDDGGYERLTLHLGDPKPDVFDQMRGGGLGRWGDDDIGTWLPWGLKGDAGTKVTADPSTNAILLDSGTGVEITEDTATYKLTIKVADNTYAPATHDLLDGTVHSDTTAAEPSVGSLIIGVTGPTWDELVIGPLGSILVSNGTVPTWLGGVVRGDLLIGINGPMWSQLSVGGAGTVLGSDGTDVSWVAGNTGTPGTLTVSTTNAAGSPHTHAITTSDDPGAAASILATDASGYLELVRLEIAAATNYVYSPGAGQVELVGSTLAGLGGNAGSQAVWVSSAAFYPAPSATLTLGAAAALWTTVYANEGEIGGITYTTHHHHYDKANTPTGAGSQHRHTIGYDCVYSAYADGTGSHRHEVSQAVYHSGTGSGEANSSYESSHTHGLTYTSTNSSAAQD